jgi:hypothetical protein
VSPGDDVVICPACGQEVPEGTFCIRCGSPLAEAATAARTRRHFSAAPHEGLHRPAVISSMFPQLPRASMLTFRLALGLGLAVVILLAVLGLYTLALVAAAVLVPLLTVLYLWDVDIYEDEPISVMAFTMAWGAAAGVLVGLIGRALVPSSATLFVQSTASTAPARGVLLPLLGTALVVAGPLILLPYRKFNDVLDGATFGGAAAVTFAGAQVLTQSFSFLSSAGLHPVGTVGFWIIRLVELAVAVPVLAGSAIGAAVAAFWLRYRAPVRDREALGVLGRPPIALAAAAALLVLGALAQVYLSALFALIALLVLDVAALIWLRRVLHLGLVQESLEIDVGEDIICPNCRQPTPQHTFCRNCGIALAALPKTRPPKASPTQEATP